MRKFFKSKGLILAACVIAFVCASVGMASLFSTKTDTSKVEMTNTTRFSAQENVVPIAMAADDNYTYPTLVAITSLMESSKKDTYYDIYIMTQGKFSEENSKKLLNLHDKYDNRCKINLIDMKDRYKDANDSGHITTPAYYRLSLSSLLPDLNKIIWVDGDTLTFEDLTDMFNIDMNGLYYRGFLDSNVHGSKDFGVENDHYICSGVMLINLEKLRQDNIEEKFEAFIKENNDRLVQHDQTVINVICAKNIGILPAKYGIFNFHDVTLARQHAKGLIAKDRYTESEMQEAYNSPAILHCVHKPWGDFGLHRRDLWLSYAEKTGYLEEIKAKYQIS